MYAYTWDEETGGLLLNSSHLQFSKEPRPVYWRELDLLGFDKYWKYPHDDSAPIMWAEANNYIYRGKTVAKLVGGSLRNTPKIELDNEFGAMSGQLIPTNIELMVQKNKDILDTLTQSTIKTIYNDYTSHKKSVDVFYVAFSGGKDSMVVLDLVQKALPHSSFKVIFGDTYMEFPDTYRVIEYVKKWCEDQGMDFRIAKAHMKPDVTWRLFGPPATVNRWCCSVHKTAPQIVLLKEICEKDNFRGFAFIGVRRAESASRSEYEELSEGQKHKGQISCNPIIEWNSAELFLYIYSHNLLINAAYLKGNRRAGCLVCPRAAERNEYIAKACYSKDFNRLENLIRESYSERFSDEARLNEFIANGGWKARKNGQDLNVTIPYEEIVEKDWLKISIPDTTTSWQEWIKTIGVIQNERSPYQILHKSELFNFYVIAENGASTIKINSGLIRTHPLFIKLFKNVFRKAANCVGCRVCEADCPHGHLHFIKGEVHIDDGCMHCSQCHKVETGCLVYKSLVKPKSITKMANKSLNCYSHHAPKLDWFTQFFKYGENFKDSHTLGSNMYDFFKRFLRDSELTVTSDLKHTSFANVIDRLGMDNDVSWALMLVNLVYTPQFNWTVTNVNFGETYGVDYIKSQLVEAGAKESWVGDVCSCYVRFSELPFSKVGYISVELNKKKLIGIKREPVANLDPRVLLYSLFKYAEACGDYRQFTMSRLFDTTIESDGVSPVRIFGIEEESMEKMLRGLSINYPEYINVTFTHDLDNITLKDGMTYQDVLSLF